MRQLPHEKTSPHTYYVLGANGGGVTVLSQLVKMAALEALTDHPILDLFPGGIIFDSGGGFLVAGLQKFSARDLMSTFISTAPKGMPTNRFLMMQAFHATMSSKGHSLRLDPSAMIESLNILVGKDTIEKIPFGFSAGLYNITAGYNREATHIRKVPQISTGKYCYHGLPETSFSDIVLAGASIPTLYSFGRIGGIEGDFADATIDQNPCIYIGDLKRANPGISTCFVRLGNFSPSPEKMEFMLRHGTAISYRSWIRTLQRSIFKRSEETSLLLDDYKTPTIDFETLIGPEEKETPTFSPIQADETQMRRICLTTIRDIRIRGKDYCDLANKLLANQPDFGHEKNVSPDSLHKILDGITSQVMTLLPPKKEREKANYSAKRYLSLAKDFVRAVRSSQSYENLIKQIEQTLNPKYHKNRMTESNNGGNDVSSPPLPK